MSVCLKKRSTAKLIEHLKLLLIRKRYEEADVYVEKLSYITNLFECEQTSPSRLLLNKLLKDVSLYLS